MLLLADPIILLAPGRGAEKQTWDQYHDYLLDCNDVIDTGLHDITLSEICEMALIGSDRYPEHAHQLQQWLNEADVDTFDATTLLSLLRAIAHRAPRLAERFNIEFEHDVDDTSAIWIQNGSLILIQQDQIRVRPTYLVSRLMDQKELADAFHLTAGLLAYALEYCDKPLITKEDFAILTIEDTVDGQVLDQIEVEAVITDKTDVAKTARLEAMLAPRSLLDVSEEPETIMGYWPNSDSMLRFISAIYGDKISLEKYHFAGTFVKSLSDMRLDKDPGELVHIITKIYQLLSPPAPNQPPSPPVPTKYNHHIKEKRGQIVDGDWGAWRYHLSGKKYKLHYWWRQNDRCFLLSKITGGHTDMNIDSNTSDKSNL